MPLRVVILQPALPKYRVPVFRELARRPGLDLLLVYGRFPTIPNVAPDGFQAREHLHRTLPLPGGDWLWHTPPRELLRAGACDVLVIPWNLRYLSMVPLLLHARAQRLPVVLWGHGYSKHEDRSKRRLRYAVIRLADAVVVYNYRVADAVVRAGLPRTRVFVALNALDQAPIRAAAADWLARPQDLAAFRHEGRIASGPNLLFVSRLDPGNRVDVLIRAVDILRRTLPGARATIVGGGADMPNLAALAASLGIEDRIRLVGPLYEESALAPHFLTADLFVYPANIGLSILHAMGYGLPVVTGDRLDTQNPEIEALRPGENGLLFAHGDPAALAATIASLHADPHRLATMRAAAAATTERFTTGRMADGLEAAARLVAARARKQSSEPESLMAGAAAPPPRLDAAAGRFAVDPIAPRADAVA